MGQWHQTNLTRNQIKAELFEFNKIRSDTNFIRIKSTFLKVQQVSFTGRERHRCPVVGLGDMDKIKYYNIFDQVSISQQYCRDYYW